MPHLRRHKWGLWHNKKKRKKQTVFCLLKNESKAKQREWKVRRLKQQITRKKRIYFIYYFLYFHLHFILILFLFSFHFDFHFISILFLFWFYFYFYLNFIFIFIWILFYVIFTLYLLEKVLARVSGILEFCF